MVDEALKLVLSDPEAALQLLEDRDAAFRELTERMAETPDDWALRFRTAALFFHCGLLQDAIKHFQKTVQIPEHELASYNMLGQAFVKDRRFGLDMAVRQFRKGLEAKGHAAQDYLELRYNLAMLLIQNGRLHEAVTELKQILAVDVGFRDVAEWVRWIEGGGPPFDGPPGVAAGLPFPPRPITGAVGKRWPKGRA